MSATKADELENDPRFKFGPPLIQTPEDAEIQYLRGVIDEDEFRAALARFGVSATTKQVKPIPPDRLDTAFERKIPDDLQPQQDRDLDELKEETVKVVDAKAKLRDAATKEAEGDKSPEETKKREQDANWVHKMEEKFLVPALAEQTTFNSPGKNADATKSSTASSTDKK